MNPTISILISHYSRFIKNIISKILKSNLISNCSIGCELSTNCLGIIYNNAFDREKVRSDSRFKKWECIQRLGCNKVKLFKTKKIACFQISSKINEQRPKLICQAYNKKISYFINAPIVSLNLNKLSCFNSTKFYGSKKISSNKYLSVKTKGKKVEEKLDCENHKVLKYLFRPRNFEILTNFNL
jgi:hypothetical protein